MEKHGPLPVHGHEGPGDVAAEVVGGEAAQHAVDQDRLHLLAEHPSTVVVAAGVDDWLTLASLCALTGGYATASAAMAAIDDRCWVPSARTSLYEQIAGGQLTVEVDD